MGRRTGILLSYEFRKLLRGLLWLNLPSTWQPLARFTVAMPCRTAIHKQYCSQCSYRWTS